ncbi:hypothetical protein [Ferrovum myxofaciens]|uniref:hypothetical protein n=1 Tax=Ferrovum myxofaciens TaxID=416213 RepID=UPI0012375DA8|nr:hypothetical protein [Ferrovum myxofaciens]
MISNIQRVTGTGCNDAVQRIESAAGTVYHTVDGGIASRRKTVNTCSEMTSWTNNYYIDLISINNDYKSIFMDFLPKYSFFIKKFRNDPVNTRKVAYLVNGLTHPPPNETLLPKPTKSTP